jgi:hypothetical protein
MAGTTKNAHAADCVDGSKCGEAAHCPPDVMLPAEQSRQVAQAAFVAGLVHATLAQGGWTILEADPATGRVRVGCAALFTPGVVADITVAMGQLESPP